MQMRLDSEEAWGPLPPFSCPQAITQHFLLFNAILIALNKLHLLLIIQYSKFKRMFSVFDILVLLNKRCSCIMSRNNFLENGQNFFKFQKSLKVQDLIIKLCCRKTVTFKKFSSAHLGPWTFANDNSNMKIPDICSMQVTQKCRKIRNVVLTVVIKALVQAMAEMVETLVQGANGLCLYPDVTECQSLKRIQRYELKLGWN